MRVKQIVMGVGELVEQQAALEWRLVHFPPLWQDLGQVPGRDLEARVVGAESGQELWPRPAQAPDLQLEWLTEVAEPMEWDAPLGMEQPAGLLLQWAPQAR